MRRIDLVLLGSVFVLLLLHSACGWLYPSSSVLALQAQKHLEQHQTRGAQDHVRSLNFTQKLDHFNFQEKRTFNQRYYINDQFWNGTGPAYFWVGAETETGVYCVTALASLYYAEKTNGLLIGAEHRYYGQSRPFGQNPTIEELGWLTIEQALADYAVIVKHVMDMYNATVPVYCLGGSYAGLLSAVLRMKYGNVFWGSIASAAPILGEVSNSEEWFAIVSRTFVEYNYQCGKNIRQGFMTLGQMANTPAGRVTLANQLGLCFPLQTADQAMDALFWGMYAFSFFSEFNYPQNFLWPFAPPVNHICNTIMTNSSLNSSYAVALAIRAAYNFSASPVQCFNSTDLWATGAAAVLQVREWHYQVCTAMTIPVGSDGVDDLFLPFPWTKTSIPYINQCVQLYNVTPDLSYIEDYLIGSKMNSYSRVIYTNGLYDPVRGYSPRHDVTPDIISLLAVSAHTQDLAYPQPSDSPSLKALRQNVLNYLDEWTYLYYHPID